MADKLTAPIAELRILDIPSPSSADDGAQRHTHYSDGSWIT
jgi:hypothetical protein